MAYAEVLKTSVRKDMRVRLSPWAPKHKSKIIYNSYMLSTFSVKVKIAFSFLILLVLIGATINYSKSLEQNSTKLPTGLEETHKFLKWINRWKERFPQIDADSFKKVDDGEIISSTNPRYTFKAINLDEVKAEIQKVKDDKYVVVAPDKLQYLKFNEFYITPPEASSSYVYYYGIRDNKIVAGPIYECKKTKCYFDRPFFQTPDLFYLPEVEEEIDTKDPDRCARVNICTYRLFLHEFDLKKNNRNTFESNKILTDFKEITEVLKDL